MRGLAVSMVLAAIAVPANAASLVAHYDLDGSFASSVNAAPALIPVDPLAVSGFTTDSVFGITQTVYRFGGTTASQGGLTFDNGGGELTSNSYSVLMTVKLDAGNGFRRLLDVTNRVSDTGFYVFPNDPLGVYNVDAGGALVTNGTYHNIALTVGFDGAVSAYLDGALSFSTTTSVMDINNSASLVHFFLDDLSVGGEWSSGSVDQISLYDGVLSGAEAAALTTPVPEPGEWAMMVAGLGIVGLFARRRRTA